MRSRASSAGKPTSQTVSRVLRSKAKLRKPQRSTRKRSEEELRLVEHEDRKRVLLERKMGDGALEVAPELGAAVGRLHAELEREGSVDVEGGDGGVAQVERLEVGFGAAGRQRLRMAAVLPTPGSAVSTPRPGSSTSSWKYISRC
jgi:hypothetical protein